MNRIKSAAAFFRYNALHIFGGRFVVFLGLALGLFFLVLIIGLLGRGGTPNSERLYNYLLAPGILLIFYPTVYGIQRDQDTRMVETLFGIPDYRYKVWLTRYVMILVIVFVLLFPFAALSYYALMSLPMVRMVLQLMVLVFFVSALGFCVSTIVKNGNASAVIMVIFGLVFLILADEIEYSKWNIFLNPFQIPYDINEIVWQETIRQNRIIMGIASVVLLLLGLLNLQQREKFLR